jgi:hypothetical protein
LELSHGKAKKKKKKNPWHYYWCHIVLAYRRGSTRSWLQWKSLGKDWRSWSRWYPS